MIYFLVFIFGLAIGSFLNALTYRLRHGYSLLGRSACPFCHHRLGATDLVPILSFVLSKGKCRYCSRAISWQYPLVELVTAITFTLMAFGLGLSLAPLSIIGLLFSWVFISLLIGVFVFDWKYYLIPDSLVLVGVGCAVFYRIIFPQLALWDGIAGALLVSGFLGLLYLVSKGEWIGLGDAKLAVFLGLLLGWKMSLLMLMLAYISGALVGVVLVLLRKKSLKGILPFGTFLTFATVIMMLWGNVILEWYARAIYL